MAAAVSVNKEHEPPPLLDPISNSEGTGASHSHGQSSTSHPTFGRQRLDPLAPYSHDTKDPSTPLGKDAPSLVPERSRRLHPVEHQPTSRRRAPSPAAPEVSIIDVLGRDQLVYSAPPASVGKHHQTLGTHAVIRDTSQAWRARVWAKINRDCSPMEASTRSSPRLYDRQINPECSKRRFSLRLSNGEDDQKRMRAEHGHALRSKEALPMREHGDHGDRSYQPPSTSASSRFERSTSDESNSSSGGAPSHKNAWLPHSHAAAPSWRGRDTQYHLTSPSHPYQTSTSASTRMPSHPGFALSSGQPLVKPPAKTQAAFVGKLYSMLENEEILRTGLIRWSAGGTMITCPNPTEFAKTVLPRFFKHNNWQSFVRQLNMYSFNKVNDLYTTTSEPQAWEFRHPLFRQGEPHLLASIKRKSTRNNNNNNKINNASDPQSATDEEGKGGLAGWMRSGSIVASSPRESDRHRPDVYGMNVQTGEMATARTTDNVRREFWDGSIHPGGTRTAQQLGTGSAAIEQLTNKFHPDPSRPPLSGHRFAPSGGFPESPLYPSPPQHWPIEATGAHIAALEGNLQRVSYTLQHERVERARADIDLVAYVGQIVGWISSGHPPNGVELHVLQDTLQRTSAELMARYEELAAGVVIPAPGVVQHPVPTEQQHHTPILNAAIQYGPSRPMSSRSAAHTAPPPLNRMPSHYTPRSSPLPSSTLTDPFMRAFGSPRAATIPGEMPPPRRAPPTPHASVATIPPPTPAVKTDTEATAPAIASAPTSASVPTAGSGSESAPATAPASAATSDDPASRERVPGLRNLLN